MCNLEDILTDNLKEAKTNFFGNVKIPGEDFCWLFTLKNSSLWEEYHAFKGSGPASKIAFAS